MEYYNQSAKECLIKLNSSQNGLSQAEAQNRLGEASKFQIKGEKKRNAFIKFLSQLKDLMVLILLISAVVSILIGALTKSSSEVVDGVIILGIVFVNALFGFLQENKTEKAIEKLKKMTQAETCVLRDGKLVKIASNLLVKGDIVVLEAGSIVPADLRIIDCKNFKLNESMLTGESAAVEKHADVIGRDTIIADRKNIAYCGSVVESGHGIGVVYALGVETEFGKIAESLKSTKKEMTPLQKNIQSVGKVLTYIVLLIASVTFILETIANPSQILNAFLTAVAISVAAIPESMPAVITIIMSLGIAELSSKRAIVKKMHAVETLGCCDVICSDKTGTITKNQMTVQKVFTNFAENSPFFQTFLNCMVLCNDAAMGEKGYVGEATEVALLNYAAKMGTRKEKTNFNRLDENPFCSGRNMMSTLNDVQGKKFVFVKGAIDKVLAKCTKIAINDTILPLTDNFKRNILKNNSQMCGDALRVLAFAYAEREILTEDNLTFLGLCGMQDPPREEIAEAVEKCRQAGMRAVMITGDYKETAFAIAKKVGIAQESSQVISGEEIDACSDSEFREVVERVSVYARVSPQHKVRIVETLKQNGHNVAMTGDGVNDAPSMKRANIGIGMGKGGTDVTKEVADIVVTDDNFATIVVAVEQGRKIYANIQKTIKFLFSANMAEILSLFFVTIFFPGLTFLLPVQILFVNLITDSLPALALGVEKCESGIMHEKPRSAKSGLFSNGVGVSIVVLGVLQTILTMSAYLFGYFLYDTLTATTMAFYTLNLLQLFYMFTARCKEHIFRSNPFKNKMFTLSMVLGIGLLVLIATTPLREVLKLCNLDAICWVIVLVFSLSIILFGEIYKFIENKISKKILKKSKNT